MNNNDEQESYFFLSFTLTHKRLRSEVTFHCSCEKWNNRFYFPSGPCLSLNYQWKLCTAKISNRVLLTSRIKSSGFAASYKITAKLKQEIMIPCRSYSLDWGKPEKLVKITASDTLEHQPTVGLVPYACAQPYHPGSGGHGQLFRPCFVLLKMRKEKTKR